MTHANPSLSPRDLEDAFIKVTFEEECRTQTHSAATDPMFDPWVDQASAKFAEPPVFAARELRKLYPNHSITLVNDYSVNILGYPGAVVQPLSPSDLITNIVFIPLARHMSQVPGVLVDQISFGSFRIAWDKYDFLLYVIKYPYGMGWTSQHIILHEGPEEHSRSLLIAAGAWNALLHEEILVYNGNYWEKDHALWTDVQKANWEDVILKDKFKTNMQKDIGGFFESEALYKSLAIPWKRGIIMYGPPGNGKTISMKAVMKDCDAKGYAPLYVKTFKGWRGEEGAMQDVFDKARQMAPCVLILEDLDSLINPGNRSFFLNQLDGLQGNDGLLLIGSTNHLEQLDPALHSRPSRFDRKYLFDDPDEEERTLYIQYWQAKLKTNPNISFPDSLVKEVAAQTDKFSFAYLKEAFVSTLVLMAGFESDEHPEFGDVLQGQVKALREQLDKDKNISAQFAPTSAATFASPQQRPSRLGPRPGFAAAPHVKVDERSVGLGRIWDSGATTSAGIGGMPGALPAGPSQQQPGAGGRRELRSIAYNIGRSFMSPS